MNQEEFKIVTDSLRNKLGEENTALISEELVQIINNSNSQYSKIKEQADMISQINKEKEDLITTNGKLLQQIPIGLDEEKKEEVKIDEKSSFKDYFDENGKFKR